MTTSFSTLVLQDSFKTISRLNKNHSSKLLQDYFKTIWKILKDEFIDSFKTTQRLLKHFFRKPSKPVYYLSLGFNGLSKRGWQCFSCLSLFSIPFVCFPARHLILTQWSSLGLAETLHHHTWHPLYSETLGLGLVLHTFAVAVNIVSGLSLGLDSKNYYHAILYTQNWYLVSSGVQIIFMLQSSTNTQLCPFCMGFVCPKKSKAIKKEFLNKVQRDPFTPNFYCSMSLPRIWESNGHVAGKFHIYV